MKLKMFSVAVVLSVFSFGTYSLSDDHQKNEEETHTEKEKEKEKDHDDHDKDKKEEAHEEHGDDHDEKESEEAPENVGPTKGVVSYSEKEGFKLSVEAAKLFGITFLTLSGPSPWEVPNSAIVYVGDDKSIYKSNNGALKRLDITIVRKNKSTSTITANKLASGDQILITGTSFVRTAEIDLTSGDSGHGH
ncbi:MAG: hypothetical protein A4S09_06435 [Proteobacteria bacterium SG_bin7]|nr:MAG: hypothetical protein A4S09_06435 [Proteobacteria bacterium SG_bin7]